VIRTEEKLKKKISGKKKAEKNTKKALQYSFAITIIYVVVEAEMPVRHFTLP